MRDRRHEGIQIRLREALDGLAADTLPPDLANHVHSCSVCAALAEAHRKLAARLRALPLREPPAALARTIFDGALALDREAPRLARRAMLRRILTWAPVATAAAVAVVAWLAHPAPQRKRPLFIEETQEMRAQRHSPFSEEVINLASSRIGPG